MYRWYTFVLMGLLMGAHAALAEPIDLQPSLHVSAAAGSSTADEGALALGHHDPTREEGTVQGIEVGLSLRTDYHIEGFATYTFSYGLEEEWDDKLEEGFLKVVDLPGNFEVRGGRLLARFGRHNARHLHAWDRVDMPLVLGRFLGEDGLSFDGADLTWSRKDISRTYGFVLGFGEVNAHDHAHHDHDEDEHDHEADEHDHDAEEHDHGHDESGFGNQAWMARFFYNWQPTDFYYYDAGLSAAYGDNGYDLYSLVLGLDYALGWRENGLESGGRSLTWETEILLRVVDASIYEEDHELEDEHDDHDAEEHEDEHGESSEGSDQYTEFGFETSLTAGLNEQFSAGAHVGFVSGIDELAAEERWRLSPVITFRPLANDLFNFRLQYNYDILENTEEHSVWAQVNMSFGGAEVR